jgi:hypothetical protein
MPYPLISYPVISYPPLARRYVGSRSVYLIKAEENKSKLMIGSLSMQRVYDFATHNFINAHRDITFGMLC